MSLMLGLAVIYQLQFCFYQSAMPGMIAPRMSSQVILKELEKDQLKA